MLLPGAPLWCGSIMAFLTLRLGTVRSMVLAAAALTFVAILAMVTGGRPQEFLLQTLFGALLPPVAFVAVLGRWRSLTLTLQVSVVLAAAIILGMFIVLGDPTAFWTAVLREVALILGELGLVEQSSALTAQLEIVAAQMTLVVVFSLWSLFAAQLLLGYGLARALPGTGPEFGRFSELSFGRVLAGVLVLAITLAVLTKAAWLQNLAALLFATFWLQGLAMVHWLWEQQRIHGSIVVLSYIALVVLNIFFIVMLAVAGYADSWFAYRSRWRRSDN